MHPPSLRSPSRRMWLAWMAAAPTLAACDNGSGGKTGSTSTSTSSPSDPDGTTGTGDDGEGTGGGSTNDDAEAIFEASDRLEADLHRAFAATPLEDLATRAADALRTIAAACEDAPPALSSQMRTTVEGALVPLVQWGADLLTTDDLTLDSVVEAVSTLTANLEVDRAAIAQAWTDLRADADLSAAIDALPNMPELAAAIQSDADTLRAYLFTEGGWDVPQVQRVVMMEEWLVGNLHDGVDPTILDATFAGAPPPPTEFDIRDCERFKQADAELGMILGNPTNADASLFYPGHLAMGMLAFSIGTALLLPGAGFAVMAATMSMMSTLISFATIAIAAVASSILTVAAACECE